MFTRSTTIVLILWLLCQQALAAVEMLPVGPADQQQYSSSQGLPASTHCHDEYQTEQTAEIQDDALESAECCDSGGSCCVLGCSFALLASVFSPQFYTLSIDGCGSNTTPSSECLSSLYRPPIQA